ncbi:MAG: dTDP-4-dehydrorhamnose reductase [Spirochaetes bacterium]|nr:dTDP-4-dehydrorhamnose reductase [Spirochaetota bacterium]
MIWLIGNKGMLGADVEEEIQRRALRYVATDIDVDITDEERVRDFLREKDPDWIINCAAYTAVDKAEDEPERAFAINSTGIANIARCVGSGKSRIIHVSTDYVFDGLTTAEYSEDEPTSPLGVYGRSKLEGERLLKEYAAAHFIIRTAWLYGRHGRNFVYTMIKLFGEKDEVRVVADQWGSPTWSADLARMIVQIISSDSRSYGVYHYTNEGRASWHEFAREIYAISKKEGLVDRAVDITAIRTEEYPTRAARPKNSYLSKNKIKRIFNIKIPSWKESLDSFIKDISAGGREEEEK